MFFLFSFYLGSLRPHWCILGAGMPQGDVNPSAVLIFVPCTRQAARMLSTAGAKSNFARICGAARGDTQAIWRCSNKTINANQALGLDEAPHEFANPN